MIILTILLIVAGLGLAAYLFVRLYPAFGGKASPAAKASYRQLDHYANGKFINATPAPMSMNMKTLLGLLRDYARTNTNRRPARPIQVVKTAVPYAGNSGQAVVRWFGHSALMLELDGKILLIDPMFGAAPSPVPIFGGKRYSKTAPLALEQLPPIDVVLISHDHYDHLDYGSIMKIKDRVKQFIVPLGVAAHLERWGVPSEKIQEHDWWSEFHYEGLDLACTPARHFSGRGLGDRESTLWCSWVIKGREVSIFFSGDSGYADHFQEIGRKYGPFDVTFMECGQYDSRWAGIHMVPEETVQAHQDVGGNLLIPIHWGAFTLSLHEWTDPIERASKAAADKKVPLAAPQIGQALVIGAAEYPTSPWWKSV
ncbi:membrane protein [Paenibacillus nasutitermitis]|uniref:Membrane protein n=2 Tax=Paenibacillus nasutitermitis TaxID=1652958 RepID=A0A916ZDG2_9BACL|nr:membrane protein [Paenibacillus nasutitermitis]